MNSLSLKNYQPKCTIHIFGFQKEPFENSSNAAKCFEETIMATYFGTKNVHSVMADIFFFGEKLFQIFICLI